MSTSTGRKKLTLSLDGKIIREAKKVSREKGVPLSRAIENFLKFFSEPEVYCFKCGTRIESTKSKLCPKCGWIVCPNCGTCRCGLSEDTAIAVFHMRRVYEDLLAGRVKQG